MRLRNRQPKFGDKKEKFKTRRKTLSELLLTGEIQFVSTI